MLTPPATDNRPKASLAALKNRYGYRDDGSKDPQLVTIEAPSGRERWERIAKNFYEMVQP